MTPSPDASEPPIGAQANTLAVGKINITLGMSKLQVESAVGTGPDRTEFSPWGCDQGKGICGNEGTFSI